jgi:hypothetical protein
MMGLRASPVRDSANVQRLGFVMLFGVNSPHRSIEFRRSYARRKGAVSDALRFEK